MKRKFTPSKIDIAVLERVGRLGIASLTQLRKDVLKETTSSHAHWILRKLVLQHYLSPSLCDCGNILGWRLNLKNARAFSRDSAPGNPPAPHYRSSFQHDQIVAELMELFSGSPAVIGWVKEREIRRERMKDAYRLSSHEHRERLLAVPDGLIRLKRGDRQLQVAFELELRRKSMSRIRKKFVSYVTNRSVDFVFFVAEGPPLKELLLAQYRDVVRSSNEVRFSQRKNGIYFAELSEVRRQGLQAIFTGLKHSFAFADFQSPPTNA